MASQNIQGTVLDVTGKKIINARVLFKDSLKGNIKEFALVKNGMFSKQLKKKYKTVLIEVKATGFSTKSITIDNPVRNKEYAFDFILTPSSQQQLDEVLVIAKKRPFEIKNDTVAYRVDAYSDGTERKIEEVIKKLPGIEIDGKTGEIKYNGKPIETVTLDGDNLFDHNYTLGTKNINVDMVEQVQAINNYSENPLLKGIEQNDKVALNLEIKKGKVDFSGSIDYDGGAFDSGKYAQYLGTTLLGISKDQKSFAVVSHNNIGQNNSPFDFFNFNVNVEQLKENKFYAERILPETYFSNQIEAERSNINNQLFANYNTVFKLGKKIQIKTNLYYLQDRIRSEQLFENNYQIANESFTTSDEISIDKKPRYYRGDVNLKYSVSSTSLLEYSLKVKQEDITSPTRITRNDSDNFSSTLYSEDFFLKNDILWTKKISDKNALQMSALYTTNRIPQTLEISPQLWETTTKKVLQTSHIEKSHASFKASLLGAVKKDKYSFVLGVDIEENPFESYLEGFQQDYSLIQNNINYVKKMTYMAGEYNINRGLWRISPALKFRFLRQKLQNNLLQEKEASGDWLFEPSIQITRKLNLISQLGFSASYRKQTNTERFFFTNPVLISNRNLQSNVPDLRLQSIENYRFFYSINDLFNQFQFSTELSYQKLGGNYFSNSTITENITQVEYFFLPQGMDSFNGSLMVSKYIPFLESTVKLNSNVLLSNYKNIVNESTLRNNHSQLFINKISVKTGFDIPVDFENAFLWRYSNTVSEQNTFTNSTFQNTFKTIVNPSKKWSFDILADYFLPNTKNRHENFLFLDATFNYLPKDKPWQMALIIKNIFNENNFQQVQTTDVSTFLYSNNLLPRHFLLSFSWNF